jgi:putative ABC transport system permease protein
MNLLNSILIAVREIWSHRMQSFLTMLGVIFGVAAVIAMVSIGEGARFEALQQVKMMGTNIIMIKRLALSGDEQVRAEEKWSYGLNYGDAVSARQILPQVLRAVPLRQVFGEVGYGSRKAKIAKIFGTTAEYPLISRVSVARGRFINDDDLRDKSRVCVLGSSVKRQIFAYEDAIGKKVKLGETWFTVAGVMESRALSTGKAVMETRDINQDVYIPLSVSIESFQIYNPQATAPSRLAIRKMIASMATRQALEKSPVSEIVIQVAEEREIIEIAALLKRLLLRRHRDTADFEVVIPSELLRQSQKTQRIFNMIMAAIAGISLLVGGIGIMNIMLATISQRTKEIGIRRCVGARRSHIILQFLVECLAITTMGGIIGILLGCGLASAINSYAHWITIVSPAAIVLSFSVSVMVGIIFGLYPALRAASLDPVQALKYE